jgi:hypothetical protein
VLPSLLSEHYLKDIFNTDEGGLFSNLLPDKTSGFQKMKTVLEAGGVKILLLCLLVKFKYGWIWKNAFPGNWKVLQPYEVLAMKTVFEAGVKILLLCLLVNANMDGCGKMPFLVTGKYSKHEKSLLFVQFQISLKKEHGNKNPENTIVRPVCITAPWHTRASRQQNPLGTGKFCFIYI